jgi:hypothetical protein
MGSSRATLAKEACFSRAQVLAESAMRSVASVPLVTPTSPAAAAAALGKRPAGCWPTGSLRFPRRPLTAVEVSWLRAEGQVPPGVIAWADRSWALAHGFPLAGLGRSPASAGS